MADPPDGLLGRLFPGNDPAALYGGALTDPATQAQMNQRGLLAMAGSFADSAMPTRMPTPLGAVLGHAAAAMGTSGDAVMGARLQEAQSEQARAQAYLATQTGGVRGMLPDLIKGYMTADGGAAVTPQTPGAATGATGGAGGAVSPVSFDELAGGVKGSWFGNSEGWEDKSDSGLQANGSPVAGNPGIALPIPKSSPQFGLLYNVTTPDGRTFQLRQTDVGPATKTGRAVDINSEAAKAMNYTPKTFPTDGKFKVELAANQTSPGGAAAPAGPAPGQVAAADTTVGGLLHMPDPGTIAGGMKAPIPGVAPAGGGSDMTGPQGTGPVTVGASTLTRAELSPATIATLKARGMTDADIARIQSAPSGPAPAPAPPVGSAGPNLQPGGAMQRPPGLLDPTAGIPSPPALEPAPPPVAPPPAPAPPPQSLVQQPPAAPAVPPPARPQAATAPPPAAPAPGTMSGVPSPEKIAAAKKLVLAWSLSGLGPVPATIAADAAWDTDTAKAVREQQIKLQFAGPMASATLPQELLKARAGPAERGVQARLTAGDELVTLPDGSMTQRKYLPGFTMAGGGGGGGGAVPGLPTTAGPGGTPATGPGSPGTAGMPILAPGTSPAQAKLFESTLASADKQLQPLQAEGLAAPQQITNAEEITDLLGRTRMGWGADTAQQAAMIMRSLGVSDDNIKQFTSAGANIGADPTIGGALNKMFLKFSSDAVLRLGTHEAASVMGQFAKTYPSLESDPKAAELMTNALRMEAQWRLDRANAADAWNADQKKNMGQFGQNYHGLDGFHASFNQTNNPQNYWRAALAMSGFSDLAFRGTSKAQQAAIFAHVPQGRQVVGPSGQSGTKPLEAQ